MHRRPWTLLESFWPIFLGGGRERLGGLLETVQSWSHSLGVSWPSSSPPPWRCLWPRRGGSAQPAEGPGFSAWNLQVKGSSSG